MKTSKLFLALTLTLSGLVTDAAFAQSTQRIAQSNPSPQTANELAVWNQAQLKNTPAAFQEYLVAFPNGHFSTLATSRASSSLLDDMLPVAPSPDNPIVQTEMALTRRNWDEAAWSRVTTANSHAAYREYLIHLPTGIHQQEALTRYQATMPLAPLVRPEQCAERDKDAQVSVGFDSRRAFPDSAIEKWSDGIVIGSSYIDYTGQTLGFKASFSSDPNIFEPAARTAIAKTRYTPKVVNCAQVPSIQPVMISYLLLDRPYESRENAINSNLNASLGVRLNGQLPADRAVLVNFTPSAGTSVYEVEFQSRFEPLLFQVMKDKPRPLPLVNNKLFVTMSSEPITLRVSSRDKPNSRRQNMGNFNLIIRQVFNQPPSN